MSSLPPPRGSAEPGTPAATEPKADRRVLGAVAALALGGLATYLVLRGPTDPLPTGGEGGASSERALAGGQGGTAGAAAQPLCRVTPHRKAVGLRPEGAGPARPRASEGDAGAADDEWLAPSGVSVGRAAVSTRGFALGVRRDGAGGSVADVVRIDGEGVAAPWISLGPVRGDLDAPAVFSDGAQLVVALLEPDAAGYSLRIGRIEGDAVRWTEDLPQRRDESLAVDLAFGPAALAVVWDEADATGERSEITVAALEPATLRTARQARRVSAGGVDGELPRVVSRPGGFWVAYVARKPAKLPARPSNADLQRDPEENRHPAELIEPAWIEVAPLDETGTPIGPPRAATAPSGHAQEFDLEAGDDGAAWLVWRDDDTPTGAQGGTLHAVRVTMAGIGEPHLVADESRMLGGPQLLGPWLVASDGQASLQLGRIGPGAQPTLPLRPEPALGRGLPLAATADQVLVATPVRDGVDLELIGCIVPPALPAAAGSPPSASLPGRAPASSAPTR